MTKRFCLDGLPYEDHSNLRAQIRSPWRRMLAWYVDKAFIGGENDLNRAAQRFLEVNQSAVVLDLGTGDGERFLWWAAHIGSRELHALDAVANAHPDQIRTTIAPLDHAWPYSDGVFDVVISSMNIEHIIDTPLYLDEARRVLKPGGYLMVMTENLASWINIGATVLGWMPFSLTNMFGHSFGNKLVWHAGLPKQNTSNFYRQKLWGCLGHQRVFTPFALRQLGERHGFKWEVSFGDGYMPFWGFLSRWFSRWDVTHAHFIGVKLRKPSL